MTSGLRLWVIGLYSRNTNGTTLRPLCGLRLRVFSCRLPRGTRPGRSTRCRRARPRTKARPPRRAKETTALRRMSPSFTKCGSSQRQNTRRRHPSTQKRRSRKCQTTLWRQRWRAETSRSCYLCGSVVDHFDRTGWFVLTGVFRPDCGRRGRRRCRGEAHQRALQEDAHAWPGNCQRSVAALFRLSR